MLSVTSSRPRDSEVTVQFQPLRGTGRKKSIICSSYNPPPPPPRFSLSSAFGYPPLPPQIKLYFQCVVCFTRFRSSPFPQENCCKSNLPKIVMQLSLPKKNYLSLLLLFHAEAEINNTAFCRDPREGPNMSQKYWH